MSDAGSIGPVGVTPDGTDGAESPAVAVVGAGVTGLAVTHYLADRGVPVRTFEAADKAGGVIRSRRIRGRVAELGPQRLRLTPGLSELVEAAGLGEELLTTDGGPLWVYHEGRLRRAPLSARAAVETTLLSWRGKLRVLLEPLMSPPRAGESVANALRRNVGREATDRLFAPLYAGLYGSDPAEMPAEHSLCRALSNHGVGRSALLSAVRHVLRGGDRPPITSVRGGLGRLPEALADRYSDRVALSTPVVGVERAGDRWRVETPTESHVVGDVVLTTPADVTAALLAGVDPETAAALDELRYNPVAHVYLDADYEPDGIGYKTTPETPLRTDGATFAPALFGDDRAFAVAMSDARDRAVLDADESELCAVAAREFETVTGAAAEALGVHRWERGIPAYDRSFDARGRVDPPRGVHLAANYTARAGVPGRIRQAASLAATLDRRGESGAPNPAREGTDETEGA